MEEAWSELFLLCAIQWSMPMESSPLLANHEQNQSKSGSLYCEIRVLQEIFTRFKNIQVDPGEFACLKAVSLFKPGKCKPTINDAMFVFSVKHRVWHLY